MPGLSQAPRLLFDFFERSAASFADNIAVEVPPSRQRAQRSRVTYAELRRQVAAVRARLQDRIGRDSIVAILLPRDSHLLYVAQLAVLEAGGAYTCIDTSYPDERARFILEDSGARLLLTNDAGRKRATAWKLDADLVRDVALLTADTQAAIVADATRADAQSLAYVIYTSGTTGRPKGVLIEQQSIVNLVDSDLECFGLTSRDRVVQGSSPAYDSSIEETWLAFAAGATLVVMDEETARLGPDLIEWLREERISVFCPPPTLLRACGCEDPARALPDLKLLYVGGEALPRDLAARWSRGRRLENGYGPTECTVTCVRGTMRADEPVTIGRAIRGMRAHVLDENREDAQGEQPGELYLSGVGLARGYLNCPELDAQKFVQDPRLGRIYRTGDLARRMPSGELECLGRIDSQVKLRGHRIELDEVDLALASCPGVRAAASRVQGENGDSILVACIVAEHAHAPPRVAELQAALRRTLPESMTPTRFCFVQALPTNTAGKLDRAALPFVDARHSEPRRDSRAPRDPLEVSIADAFRCALGIESAVGADDDFFHDLGGNSLAAAMAVSRMRADPATASLAVRDVYEARCVSKLAELARSSGESELQAGAFGVRAPGRPQRVAIVQALWLFARLVVVSIVLCLGLFELAPALLGKFGVTWTLVLAAPFAPVLLALHAFLALGWAVFLKRSLIGRYVPLRAPVWSDFYLRNWIVQQAVRSVPWRLLQGSELQLAALRALGAKIGVRVHLHRGVDLLDGGWDLLEIGDDVTLAQDSALRLVELEDGEIHVGSVLLGAQVSLETRSEVGMHCAVGSGAQLSASSALMEGERIPAGERWDGVPATRLGRSESVSRPSREDRELSASAHAALLGFGRACATFLVGYFPAAALALGALRVAGLDTPDVLAWLAKPTLTLAVLLPVIVLMVADVVLSLGLRALLCRALGPVRAGTVPIRSAACVRATLKTEQLDAASHWLSGTLFWPPWLRAAGMRIGRNCEISTIIDVVPELVEIGEESFLADGIYLGGAHLERGQATFATTRLGRDTFVGNHAVIPGGASLQGPLLLGLSTVADASRMKSGSSWFGHPAFELPVRETVHPEEFTRARTHSPGALPYLSRLFWESLRLALPIVPLCVALRAYEFAAASLVGRAFDLGTVFSVLLASAGALATLCLFVLALKWLLLGRVQPGRHPLWSCWCSRWDFLYVAWAQHAHGVLSKLEGTLLLPWYLRAMGCRIGKGTVLGGGFAQVVDPDMLTIEDGATVVGMFQAHTFEDRVLKIDRITIRREATVGAGAVLFYGADIGERAEVAPHSVVMKHERLSPGRFYVGCPTRSMPRRFSARSGVGALETSAIVASPQRD